MFREDIFVHTLQKVFFVHKEIELSRKNTTYSEELIFYSPLHEIIFIFLYILERIKFLPSALSEMIFVALRIL